MSITGISNYGLQNVTNEDVGQAQYTDLTSRVEQAETDIEALEAQVGVNETDIGALDARVDTLETEMNAVEAVNTTQNTSISSILQRITDITYNAGSDLTSINNRVTIRATIESGTSAAAQLSLFNTSTQEENKVQMAILCGVESGNWSNLAREGDCLFLCRNQSGISNTWFGGMLFVTHGGSSGFRFSFDPARDSVFRSNVNLEGNRVYTTGNMASGTFTLNGVDLGTTLSTLNTSVANNTFKLSPVTYFHAPAIPGVTPEVESYTLNSLQIALNGEVTINGRNVLTELTDLSAEVAAIDHHLLTEDLDCAGFDINACGTLTAVEVIAGGYNVKNRIVTLQNEVQALEDVDHNTAPADLNMNGFNIVNNRQLQLVTGIKSATLSIENVDDLEARPPLNGNFVVSTSVSGGPKSFTVGHDVVDFNGRMIINASFYLPEERAQQEISILEDWVIQPFTFGAGTSLQGGNVQWRLTGTSFGLQLSNETTTALSEHTAQHPGVIHIRLRYSPSGNDSNGTLTWHSEQGVHSSAFTTGRTIFKIGARPPGGLGVNVYPDFRVKIGLSNDTSFSSAVHWDCDANGAWKLYVNGTVVYTSTVFLNFTAGSWMSVYFVRISGGIRGVIELADHSVVDSYDFIGSRPGKFKPMISLIGNNTFVSGLPDRDLYLDYTDFQYSATRV